MPSEQVHSGISNDKTCFYNDAGQTVFKRKAIIRE